MPPHCDSMDGPVVKAAMKALDTRDVTTILPFVPKQGETEVTETFEKVLVARAQSPEAQEVADKQFFETVVRIHRAGEGAPFTGLKPAGLSHGPVVPVAEKAIEDGSSEDLLKLLTSAVEEQTRGRFEHVMHLKREASGKGVKEKREYVEAMLGLEVYSHKLYECAHSEPHGEGAHHHEHAA
ncbi:MAG TPA: DUF6448 family protein [Rubrobacteraceae bacterium]|nr:DUF6448 family protein [Rubrobacteraceae bacterium]